MPNYATETDVREKLQLTDTTLVPTALVTRSLDDAHTEILRRIDLQFDVAPAADGVVLGETHLASAHLLRSLASARAFDRRDLTIGGQRIEPDSAEGVMRVLADDLEDRRWTTLEPFLKARSARAVAAPTDTQPVLGEE